jgi:hypothetical protein
MAEIPVFILFKFYGQMDNESSFCVQEKLGIAADVRRLILYKKS